MFCGLFISRPIDYATDGVRDICILQSWDSTYVHFTIAGSMRVWVLYFLAFQKEAFANPRFSDLLLFTHSGFYVLWISRFEDFTIWEVHDFWMLRVLGFRFSRLLAPARSWIYEVLPRGLVHSPSSIEIGERGIDARRWGRGVHRSPLASSRKIEMQKKMLPSDIRHFPHNSGSDTNFIHRVGQICLSYIFCFKTFNPHPMHEVALFA